MVRLGTFMDVRDFERAGSGAAAHNLYSADHHRKSGSSPGTSSGQAAKVMQSIVDQEMPRSMASDWTELMYLQLQAGNAALYAFGLAVAFVFLVLAAQYELETTWPSILVVPMCLLSSPSSACSLNGWK